jgi:Rieske 2Fe-2S family protein
VTTDTSAEYFFGLPGDRYTSIERYNLEVNAIHYRHWLYGCHASELPNPGDYVIREVGSRDSVILIRDEGGNIHAFFNVCRHRGARLCMEYSGHVDRLRCPYHFWTYGLDGRLKGTHKQTLGDAVSKLNLSLVPAHVEVWRGHVFLCASPDRPAVLTPELDSAAPDVALFAPEHTKVAAWRNYSIHANWKLVMQNFWECYHCRPRHPEFSVAADIEALNGSNFGDVSADDVRVSRVVNGPLPLKTGMASLTMNGERESRKPLGSFATVPDFSKPTPTTGVILRYSTAITYFPDYGICLDFQPISPTETRLVSRWFVHQDAHEGSDYDVNSLVKLWHITNEQDGVLAELNQLGVQSTQYIPGPHSFALEAGIYEFNKFCEQEVSTL